MPDTIAPMTELDAVIVAARTDRLSRAIGIPFGLWEHRCHEISLKLLRTGEFGPGRIARGRAAGVISQHSWIVLGDDCYSPDAVIVDPTLWSYLPSVTGIWVGPNLTRHVPHGAGSCFDGEMPIHHGGPDIALTPAVPFSPAAETWLAILGPLDFRGWGEVAHLPVGDWPAAEITAAIADTPQLRALLRIDVLGMITDRNPGHGYR